MSIKSSLILKLPVFPGNLGIDLEFTRFSLFILTILQGLIVKIAWSVLPSAKSSVSSPLRLGSSLVYRLGFEAFLHEMGR